MTDQPPPPPRWLWLLPLCAALAWWPIGSYWQSDDFVALHYTQQFGNVAHDFVGSQYAAPDLWLFYRPLITLSFWLDQQIAGTDPAFAHATNVLAHAISTLLVARIWRRFVGTGTAALIALVWALLPSQQAALAWTVGRVDSHTLVWILSTVLLVLRAVERRDRGEPAARWPYVVTTTLALLSKELAFVLPPLVTVLAFATTRSRGVPARLRCAVMLGWPLWLLFAGYLVFRWQVLGGLGGYEAARFDQLEPLQSLLGLGHILLDLLAPLRWVGGPGANAPLPEHVFMLACGAPAAIGLLLACWRRPRAALFGSGLFLLTLAPLVVFLTATENAHNLRYYYLPTTILIGVIGLGGRLPLALMLLANLWPLVAARTVQYEADRDTAHRHAALETLADTAPPGPLFVSGMPNAHPSGIALQMQFGVDRMLRPPFHAPARALYPWRPVIRTGRYVHLNAPGQPPFPLPTGHCYEFVDADTLRPAPPQPALPELVIEGDVDGVFDMSTPRLDQLLQDAPRLFATGEDSFGLTFPGVRGPWLRVTLFSSVGYLSCLCRDHALDGADGRLDILRWLAPDQRRGTTPALLAFDAPGVDIGNVLVVPTTIDLDPRFPTLIEAGKLDRKLGRFVPTHRARRMLTFAFDDDYSGWVRRVQ